GVPGVGVGGEVDEVGGGRAGQRLRGAVQQAGEGRVDADHHALAVHHRHRQGRGREDGAVGRGGGGRRARRGRRGSRREGGRGSRGGVGTGGRHDLTLRDDRSVQHHRGRRTS